ncbi:hypothetical protein ACFP7A_13990 [Sporolactobacillus kofuensis]|uniref:O-antigen ligase domain-containing protein n=1 Tax=Sporolactobacillus kofuensis TaxID=269672 RepID=A0ABW1WJ47_9BACL|nr:hypothetical protein [Sporolactobacillus kofuensis]MCO7177098.1 hypothetical protein [Sporolactobacillus kofuensis]
MKYEKMFFIFILYYFSFFYLFQIFSIGNFIIISGLKELMILFLFIDVCLKKIRFNQYHFVFVFCYVAVLIFAAFRSTTAMYIFIDSKYYFIWVLMFYITTQLFSDFEDFKKIVKHINIICVTIGCIGLICYKINYLPLLQWRSNFHIYAIKSILSTSFDFGALMALAVFFNLIVVFYEKRVKLSKLFLIGLYSSLTLLSYTRGSWISLLLFFYLFFRIFYIKKLKWINVFIKLLIDVLAVGVCYLILKNNLNDYTYFSNDSLLDRVRNVWPSLRINSFFFGGGFGTVGRSENSSSLYSVSDNSFLRIMLTLGILGLFFTICFFLEIFRKAKNKNILTVLYISVGVAAFVSDYIVFTPAMLLVYILIGFATKINFTIPRSGDTKV